MKKRWIYFMAAVMAVSLPLNALAAESAEESVSVETEPESTIDGTGENNIVDTSMSAQSGDVVTEETESDMENSGNDRTSGSGENTVTSGNEDGSFTDVDENDWYADAVKFVTSRGIMSGTSESTFSPDSPATRGMMACIINSINGTNEKVYWSYLDVPEDAWYADAIAWCSDKNIMKGYGGGYFGPNDSITREQLISTLYRYAQYRELPNLDTTGVELLDYSDYANISGYAGGPMQWALKNNILSGKENGTLDPKGIASRAEIAQIIRNFMVFYTL